MTARPSLTPTAVRPFLVTAALLVCASCRAEPPDDGPIYNPFIIQGWQLSRLTVGAAAAPSVGPLNAACALYAGTHPDHTVWALEGVLKSPEQRTLAATATLLPVGSPHALGPFALLGVLQAGDAFGCWSLVDTENLPRIPFDLLRRVRDEEPIPKLDSGDLELDAYLVALLYSARYSEAAFRDKARKATFAEMFNEPRRLRGDVVVFSGEMVRLREADAPRQVGDKADFAHVYEGWVFNHDLYGPNPLCVLFTRLPVGLEPAEKMRVPVTVYGVFFKTYRYKAGDNLKGNEWRLAPLLIGRVAVRPEAAKPEDHGWAYGLLPTFLGLLVGVGALVVVLALWYLRSDAHVRRRLRAARRAELVLPTPGPPDGAVAAAPPAPQAPDDELNFPQ
jgi:hypothetical protein